MQVKLQKGGKRRSRFIKISVWLSLLHFNEKAASKLKQPAGRQEEQAIVLIK